ncbi:type VII secretion protein EssC [Paenibacillus herberti]|uniref:Type VII secretion protein EssC n=1 Tax=Paenibacillus herberti TaxID=1619309 RepID=A0A229P0B1_9BACL|nr:type VII secretion protein EssC [Paenibacillus herberti]OXM15537.1 type VII secretion protein EssC [Paenibacillus herberti]
MTEEQRSRNQVQRTPRLMPYFPQGVLHLEDPARPSEKPIFNWMTILIPPLGMLVVSIFTALLSRSYIMIFGTIAMTIVTVLVSILNYTSSVKTHRDLVKKQEKKYLDYLFSIRNQLHDASVQQREAFEQLYPSPDECERLVRNRAKPMWERTSVEEDFLLLRLGVGIQETALVPSFESKTKAIDDENPLEDIALKICEELQYVHDVPVPLTIQEVRSLGIVGKKQEAGEFINSLIIHSTAHHGYDDLRIVGIFPQSEIGRWEWMRWLPHSWSTDRRTRFIAADASAALAIAEEVLPEMKKRLESPTGFSSTFTQAAIPHYLFLIMAPELMEETELLQLLLAQESPRGTTVMFASERINVGLPLNCQVILEVRDGIGQVRKDAGGFVPAHQFRPDSVSREQAERFARSLASVTIRDNQGSTHIPQMVTFLETFQVQRVEELRIGERWKTNQANRTLSIPLGQGSAGKLMLFDMHEKSYGPHGLVAGTTGSGKSELLQSLLLGLAVNYHPHEIAFVLIDYKGGGMANAFNGIPHLVGTITNLTGNGINRALASIKSELLRRQMLFGEAGVTSIDDYIVLHRSGQAALPLPHLLIVVDEFAELKSDQPDFMKELVSAARVGRSLGIHLILATQKPSGVVDDQIWSNSRFKLCLKVQTPSDSQEMLKRPEAAEIKEKGRGYLQVGNNEIFTLFQSSWSGAPYLPSEDSQPGYTAEIVSLHGQRSSLIPKKKSGEKQAAPSELQAVVSYLASVSADEGIKEAFQLWLPPLPEMLVLDKLLPEKQVWDGQHWPEQPDFLSIPAGLVDNPSKQSQYPLTIDFAKDGHLLVYGSPGTGKTSFLKTIVTGLALKYSPERVHIYLLDFGTRTLGVFHELPHKGDILYPEDDKKLQKMLAWMLTELEERKRKFAELGISNLRAYCNATGEKVPSLVILLDNFAGFNELYMDESMEMSKIIREGGNYGFYFVLTGNASNSIPYRITQNVKQALVFQMADRSDYTAIVGRTDGMEPGKTAGRGLVKQDAILEFQAALPVEGDSDDLQAVGIRELCVRMKQNSVFDKPKEIVMVPTALTAADLLTKLNGAGDGEASFRIPLGLDEGTVEPLLLDIRDSHTLLVSDVSEAGWLDGFRSLMGLMAPNCNMESFVYDSAGSKLQPYWPGERIIGDAEAFSALTESLVQQLQERKNEARQANAETSIDEADFILANYPLLVLILPDLESALKQMSEESLMHLERVARFGGGLGILLAARVKADELDKLQLQYSLPGLLISNESFLAIGGSLAINHSGCSTYMQDMDYEQSHLKLAEGMAWMKVANTQAQLRIPTI